MDHVWTCIYPRVLSLIAYRTWQHITALYFSPTAHAYLFPCQCKFHICVADTGKKCRVTEKRQFKSEFNFKVIHSLDTMLLQEYIISIIFNKYYWRTTLTTLYHLLFTENDLFIILQISQSRNFANFTVHCLRVTNPSLLLVQPPSNPWP